MKYAALCATIVVASSLAVAQIPNAGFEEWSGGNPVGWFANNTVGLGTPITQSQTARSGSSALRGQVIDFLGIAYPPLLQAGENTFGFPVSQRHAALTGYYQFTPVGGDRINIALWMTREGFAIGVGDLEISTSASSYTAFSVPIEYFTEENPDTCVIQIIITYADGESNVHIGSAMLIDDLAFSGITSVERTSSAVPEQFILEQNYPNPFNPTTVISYQLSVSSFVRLTVSDLLGREVAVLVNEHQQPGSYSARWNAAGLPSGAYLYRLEAGGIVQSRRLLFLK